MPMLDIQSTRSPATEAAVHVVVVLQLGACGGHAAVGHGHGAAGDVPLLHQDDAVASLQQAAGAGQAGGAGTHDDHIGLFLDDLVGGLQGDFLGEVVHVVASQLDGLLHGSLHSHGGDGGTTQVGHVDALVLDDGGGDTGAGIVADADGLLVGQHLTSGDLALKEGGSHMDPALVAHSLGDVLAVHRAGGLGNSGGCLRGCSLRGCSTGSRSTGGAGSGVATSGQQTGSSCAHGAHSGTAHKVAARDLSHSSLPFFLLVLLIGSSSFSSVPSYVLNIDMIIAKFRSAVKSKKIPDLSKTLINELYFTTEKKSAIIKEVQVLQGWGLFL